MTAGLEDGLTTGTDLLKLLECDAALPQDVVLTSIAISLKHIARNLDAINRTLETGNIGQGSNLQNLHAVAASLREIKGELSGIAHSAHMSANAKASALEAEVRNIRGW